jgi:hypothetical protein
MRLRCVVLALACACSHHHGSGAVDGSTGADGGDLPDATCGAQHIGLTYVPPNLLLVLDRSCSMRTVLAGTTTSKWEAAVNGLNHALTAYDTAVRWGATLFPDTTGDSCSQDAIPVPVADHNANPIATMLSASLVSSDPLYPDGPCVTNLDTGIEQAATDPALMDQGRASYLMLVSDGAQSGCSAGGGNSGTEAAVAALLAQGVKTFVVGFGSEVDDTELSRLATAGGTALPGTPTYYQADTAAQLDQAFQTIGSSIVSCTYTLNPPPPSLDQTYVYLGQSMVPRDPTHTDGWDYDDATHALTLYGAPCDQLRAHTASSLDVVFGCAIP